MPTQILKPLRLRNILSLSKRHRGREQDLVTAGREITITLAEEGEEDALTPVADNLCSASGAAVSHESVQIISVASGEVHENANQMAKQLISYYKKGGGEGGLLAKKARALVSGKKRRFQEDGFDLDLTYASHLAPRIMYYICDAWREEEAAEAAGDAERVQKWAARALRLRYKLLRVAGADVLQQFDRDHGRGGQPLPTYEAYIAHAAPPVPREGAISACPLTMEECEHEVLLDRGFRLPDAAGQLLEQVQRNQGGKFWNVVSSEMARGKYTYFVQTVADVRVAIEEILVDAVPEKVRPHFSNTLDIVALQNCIQQRRFNETCADAFAGVLDSIQRTQLQPRDRQDHACRAMFAQLRCVGDTHERAPWLACQSLILLVERLQTFRHNYAEARVFLNIHTFCKDGARRQRALFRLRYARGTTQLAVAQTWITRVVRQLVADDADLLRRLHEEEDAAAYHTVHHQVVLALVFDPQPLEVDNCPEILHLDLRRLQEASNEFRFMLAAAGMFLDIYTAKCARVEGAAGARTLAESFVRHFPRHHGLWPTPAQHMRAIERHLAQYPAEPTRRKAMVRTRFLHNLPGTKTGECARFRAVVRRCKAAFSDAVIKNEVPKFVGNFVGAPADVVPDSVLSRVYTNTEKTHQVIAVNIRVHGASVRRMIAAAAAAIASGAPDPAPPPALQTRALSRPMYHEPLPAFMRAT